MKTVILCFVTAFITWFLMIALWKPTADGQTAQQWESDYNSLDATYKSTSNCVLHAPKFYDYDSEGRRYNVSDSDTIANCVFNPPQN